MRSLEDAGEVNLSLAEHEVQKTEAGLALKVLHDVCFVLDPQNGKKRKKARHQLHCFPTDVELSSPGMACSLGDLSGFCHHLWARCQLHEASG